MFHALNPVIYFIFCSSYRQGVEQIFCRCYCCLVANRACGQNVAPVIEQIELKSVSRMTNITNNWSYLKVVESVIQLAIGRE